jgi:hypothetical protein
VFVERKFNSIKVLANDSILIVEPATNDLVHLNSNLQEIKRFHGIEGDSFGKF